MIPPTDSVELERLVARYARLGLGDFHAQRRGRNGQGQHGIDVLARSRGGGVLQTWAFQAKCVTKFQPAHLRNEAKKLDGYTGPVDHFVVVTTARPSTNTQDTARRIAVERGHEVAVWGWEDFSERFRDACGAGDWLGAGDRARLRTTWIRAIEQRAMSRLMLDPLVLSGRGAVAVEDLWMEPELHPAISADKSSIPSNPALWFQSGGSRLVPVLGAAGAGKTSLLWHLALTRTREAAAEPEMPLPVVVHAAALALEGGAAVARALSSTEPGALWTDPGTDWIVLVDGVDEVPPRDRARVWREVDGLVGAGTITGVVVACREEALPATRAAALGGVRLGMWSPTTIQAFDARWSDATARPQSPPRDRARPAHALEAALSACYDVSSNEPGAAWVGRQRMLEAILVAWPEPRGAGGELAPRRALEALAWHALTRPGRPLTRVDRVTLGLVDVEPLLEAESRRSGVFMLDDDGALTFVHPHVTEALAATHLAIQPAGMVVRVAASPRLAGIAHVAALGMTLRDPGALELLSGEWQAAGGSPTMALRRLGWWVRVVDDLGELARNHTDSAADALLAAAANEAWTWVRAPGQRWLADVAARGGPVWDVAWSRLSAALAAGTSRGATLAGYAEQARVDAALEQGPGFWMGFLAEEDAWVRAIATRELSLLPDFDRKRSALLLALLDHSWDSFAGEAVAVTAGRALRGWDAERDSLVADLRTILGCGRVFPAGGAALALRPGEAPLEDLLRGLRDLSRSDRSVVLSPAIDELAVMPGAAEWIAAEWTEGPTQVEPRDPLSAPFGGELPPSARVRSGLMSAIAAGFAAGDRWQSAPDFIRRDGAFLVGMARAARSRPAVADPVVVALVRDHATRPMVPFIPPEAQEELGAVAVRVGELRRALVDWWDSGRPTVRSSFPGLALEPAAAGGDVDALRVYSDWLHHAPFMQLLSSYWRPPSAAVLGKGEVAAAAAALALDRWVYATEGRTGENGERTYLAPETVGHLLRGLWPAWATTEIPNALVRRALAGERWFGPALEAFVPAGLPEPLATAVLARLERWREDRWHETLFFAAVVAATGLADRAAVPFGELVDDGNHPAMWPAAAAIASTSDSARAADVSARAAERFPAWFARGELNSEQTEALVRAAPEVWLDALERGASRHRFWAGAELLAVAQAVARVVAPEHRPRLVAVLGEICSWLQPWIPTLGTALFRPADAALALLYELEDDEP